MATFAPRWQDSRGILHDSEAAADDASRQYELGDRRRAVARHLAALIDETAPMATRHDLAPFHRTAVAVEWIIENWQALKIIGLSYRVDELNPACPAPPPPPGETEF